MRAQRTGNDLLQKWKIINNNKNNDMKIGKFLKSTKSQSPSAFSGSEFLPPIDDSFIYI